MGTVCSEMTVLVCRSEEVRDGELTSVEVEGTSLLLTRRNGTVSCLSGKCTHYGAPLSRGVLGSATVTCPWHGACFNIESGDIEDFPGVSSLVKYEVTERNGNVYISSGSLSARVTHRERYSRARTVDRQETVVVVGGGAAGHSALETFRAEGFSGRLVLISGEEALPYDRPKLSKQLNADLSKIMLRNQEWFDEANIEVYLGTEVEKVVPEENLLITRENERFKYDSLLFATGGSPRRLMVPGVDLEGVFTLRTPADAKKLYDQSQGKRLVIVGGSFIGMEVAAALVESCEKLTVVDRSKVSFQSSFGEELGQFIQKMHKEKGVVFEMEEEVKEIIGTGGNVTGVLLQSGKLIESDLVLLGIGVVPNTTPFQDVDGFLDNRGFIQVDEFMNTNIRNIFAAGDIVKFPLLPFDRKEMNIGHWGLAMYMGRIAALNIMGKHVPATSVPFFWSVQFGKSIRFAGIIQDYDEVQIDATEDSFLAVYSRLGNVQGVATLGRDPIAAYFKNYVSEGGIIKAESALVHFSNLKK